MTAQIGAVIGCFHFFICRKCVVNRFLLGFKNPVIPLFYGVFLIKGFHRGDLCPWINVVVCSSTKAYILDTLSAFYLT